MYKVIWIKKIMEFVENLDQKLDLIIQITTAGDGHAWLTGTESNAGNKLIQAAQKLGRLM